MNLFIPPKTQTLLDAHHANGTRHEAIKAISFSLVGNEWPSEMVFALLRSRFAAPDISDKEIRDLVDGAVAKAPTPSTLTERGGAPHAAQTPVMMSKRDPAPAAAKATDTLTDEERVARAKWWLSDNFTAHSALPTVSPVPIPVCPVEAATLFMESLYKPSERLNLLTRHFVDQDGKAKPQGGGKSLSRDEWKAWIAEKSIPQSDAGCWFRLNPCGDGTGKDGAVTDSDIVAHRFVLLESDLLDLDTQSSILLRLDIPIASIVASGDKSAHAAVMLAATSAEAYRELGSALLDALFRIGFDRGNKNPSRLSRFPGAVRTIKTVGDGHQRLLYLNPNCKPLDNDGLAALLIRLDKPRHPSLPMRKIIYTAINRYDAMSRGVPIPGVKTGFETFDKHNGGLRAGLYYIIAAQTNIGKSSWAINVIVNCLERGEGVALFSLEMSQDDVADILFSNRGGIHRDTWNTGLLTEGNTQSIVANTQKLSEYPLWIFDNPDQTIADIRETATGLIDQHPVSLIVVDYMQFVAVLPGRESREQQVSMISRGLKALAKTTGVAVIGISSLNDDGKLRESRGSGYDADAVMELEESGDRALIGRVTKGRFIAKKPYLFFFDKEFCRMRDGGICADEAQQKDEKKQNWKKKEPRDYHK